MGKRLIIKGADFSVNAIGNGVDIAGLIPLTRNYVRSYGVSGSGVTNKRVGTTQAFDLSEYIAQGFTKISIVPLPGIEWSCLISTVNGTDLGTNPACNNTNSKSLYPGETSFPLTVWHSGNSEIPIESNRYLQIGLKRGTDFELVNYLADSFIAIELYK